MTCLCLPLLSMGLSCLIFLFGGSRLSGWTWRSCWRVPKVWAISLLKISKIFIKLTAVGVNYDNLLLLLLVLEELERYRLQLITRVLIGWQDDLLVRGRHLGKNRILVRFLYTTVYQALFWQALCWQKQPTQGIQNFFAKKSKKKCFMFDLFFKDN